MIRRKYIDGCTCDLHKSVAPVNDAVRAASRPMRWRKAEHLAKRFVRAIMDAHVDCIAGIISDMPGNDTWASVARSNKAMNITEKKLTPEQLNRLLAEAGEVIDPILLAQVKHRIGAMQNRIWPEDSNPETVADNTLLQGDFPKYQGEAFREGMDEAYRRLQSFGGAEFSDNFIGVTFQYNPNSIFVQKMYTEGFKYVTAKITKDFMPEVLKVMMKGVAAAEPWNVIAGNLYKEVGTGYLWQWERLVRTEISRAFDLSFQEEFKNYGAEYVKWSAAIGACPICTDIANTNRGYYPIDDRPRIPEDTHPNCRCDLIPVYNLPKGVTL